MSDPVKPKHGQPCNGCGHCCRVSLCPLAQSVFRRPYDFGPCPALEKTAEGYGCGLVINPGRYSFARVVRHGAPAVSQAAQHLIGAGQGCDAVKDGEPRDPRLYAKMEDYMRKHHMAILRAIRIWDLQV